MKNLRDITLGELLALVDRPAVGETVDIFDGDAEPKFARLRGVIKKFPREARIVWLGQDLDIALSDIEEREGDPKNYEMRIEARADAGLSNMPTFTLDDISKIAETITRANMEIDRRAIEAVYERTKARALQWETPVVIGSTAIDCLNGSWLRNPDDLEISWVEGFRKAIARFGENITLGELAAKAA